jgi:P4 family phage/plasmid primase-like protien
MEHPTASLPQDSPAYNFLKLAYGHDAPGWLTAFIGSTQYTQWFRAHNLEAVAAYVLKRARDCDVYLGVGLRGERLHKGRGEAKDVIALPGLYADIDIKHPVHKAGNLPETIEQARLILDTIPLPASLIIDSGHGLQAWWLFRELWIFATAEERQAAAHLNQRLQATLRAGAQLHDWHLDGTADLARVLRVPGTTNHKDPANPVPVTILEAHPDTCYNLSDFESYLLELEDSTHSATYELIPDDVPLIHVATLKLHRWLKYLIKTGEHPDDPHRYSDRSTPEWAALQALIQAGCDDLTIAGVMLNPKHAISEKPREKGRRWLEQEIARARAKARTKDHSSSDQETEAKEASSSKEEAQAPPPNTPPEQEETSSSLRDEFHMTDLGNARRLVAKYGRDLHYCYPWNCWLIWDGKRWAKDSTGRIYRLAKQTVADMYAAASTLKDDEERKALVKHALRSEAEARINAMIALAQSEEGIPVLPEQLDKNSWALNALNGIIDLQTGRMRSHRREDLITKLAPVDYDPNAICPTWDAFLDRIMKGNKELITFLKRAVGYSTTGDASERVIFIKYGMGQNGKSTFTEMIAEMLGDYAQRTPAETLLLKRDSTIPNDVAQLPGVRFAHASETEEGRRLAEAFIKDLTGRDTISARFMRGEWFQFRPVCKVWLRTNHRPVIRGSDPAIWDRIRLIPFEVRIPDQEIDRQLPTKLQKELPGILAWAVQGCLSWLINGLGTPEKVKTATADYQAEMDVLADYLAESCTIATYAQMESTALYNDYVHWCEKNSETPLKRREFARRLQERGFEHERSTTTGRWTWKGIDLRARD